MINTCNQSLSVVFIYSPDHNSSYTVKTPSKVHGHILHMEMSQIDCNHLNYVCFQKLSDNVDGDLDDILAADYSYYILLIELLRDLTPEKFTTNLQSIMSSVKLETSFSCRRQNILDSFVEKMDEFNMELEMLNLQPEKQKSSKKSNKKADFQYIDADVFLDVVKFHHAHAKEQLKEATNGEVCSEEHLVPLLWWMLHCNGSYPDDLAPDMLTDLAVRHVDNDVFTQAKNSIIWQNETLRIVDDLIIPREAKSLDGKMKIVRVTEIKKGNTFYATVCLARKIASGNEQYMFEVIRDFGNFRFRKDLNQVKCNESLFRVRRVLQPRKCQYLDETTFEPCSLNCTNYMPKDDELTCVNCDHMHKTVKLYRDLKHLPVLLIVQKKGRLGDTFPASFNCMDLRIRYTKQVS